jgi:hypothetical protein
MKLLRYLACRLKERSTWAGISAAVVGGAALQTPYSWLVIAAGAIAILVPTRGDGS